MPTGIKKRLKTPASQKALWQYPELDDLISKKGARYYPISLCECIVFFMKALACAMIEGNVKNVKSYFKISSFYACIIEYYRILKSISSVCTPVHAELYKNDENLCYLCCRSLLVYGGRFLESIPLGESQRNEFILKTHLKIRICWQFCPHYCSKIDIQFYNITTNWQKAYASKFDMYLGQEFDDVLKKHGSLNASLQAAIYKSKTSLKCSCFKKFIRLVICHLIHHHIGNPYYYLAHKNFYKESVRFYRIAQNINVNIASDSRHRPKMCGDCYFYVFSKCRSFMHGVSHFPDKDCNKIIFDLFDRLCFVWSTCSEKCIVQYRDRDMHQKPFDLMLHSSLPHFY